MSPKARTPKPGASYFKAIRKALKAAAPSKQDKEAALAAVDGLEAEFGQAAKDRKALVTELDAKQTPST